MAFEAQLLSGEHNITMIDYTPSGAGVAAGEVVVAGDRVWIAHRAIAQDELGAVAAGGGIYRIVKDGTSGPTFAVGAEVFWDASGNLAVATASGNKHIGTCVKAAADDEAWVDVYHDPDGNST